ncbi:putative short-chain dehydrogenase/reductase family 42E member 2 [Tupaia chinensis]|uniref:putative short-chain dehydrogenase/reductase family 42E member 2 n=1 Tax=Tupaia chinensis TaxID=246437 RepID=UPI000FFB0809|nr:putative short-chain dehydrogenase/reductase family 42E member 2 [Tupaia chinensis]
MKPNSAGASPEACKASGQAEKSCPVCQAWGGVSGPGSGLGSGSGLGPGPGAISGPRLGLGTVPGPNAVPGPESGSGAVLGPGAIPRPAPGPSAILGPGPGPGAIPGPGPGPGTVPGSGAVPGVRPGSGTVSKPDAVLERGPGPGAIAGSGPEPGTVSGPDVLGPSAISKPDAVPGRGPGPGTISGPDVVLGPGAISAPRQGTGTIISGSDSVLGPRSLPGPGPGPGVVPAPRPGPGAISGPDAVPGPNAVPGPGQGAAPLPGLGPGPGPEQGSGTGPKPSEAVATPAPAPAPQQKIQAKPTQAPQQKVLVTGGGGYLGFSLGSSLAKAGTSVTLLDRRRPQWELSPGTEFIQADVRDEEALYRAFEGVDCVFHVASYGMSVCVRRRVPRLVYTSTVNVAFGGKPIEQGDEDSVPYFPLEKHMDHYSRTKAIADQLTLMANGMPLPGGGTLRTCVLRPPGIYGPEEQRHLPRVAGHIKRRLLMFRFGDRRTRMNWVHVRNLVQAHLLAAEALTAAKGYVASGQAYYINDGESVNLFEWMAPLFEKLGYSQPWIQVPTSWVYLTATVMEHLHLALRPICSIPPLLTRSEVHSVAVTHTFQIAKARAQLGYAPAKFSFADAVEQYVKSTTRQPRGSTTPTLLRLLLGLLLLGLLALALHFLGLQPLQAAVERL